MKLTNKGDGEVIVSGDGNCGVVRVETLERLWGGACWLSDKEPVW